VVGLLVVAMYHLQFVNLDFWKRDVVLIVVGIMGMSLLFLFLFKDVDIDK